MRLYFLRHADALDGMDDAARPLSPKGQKQSREIARFLKAAGIRFDAAYSSPLVRARQTAEIILDITGAVKPAKLKLVDALLNETTAREFEGWLRALPEAENVLLTGHAPTLAEHVCALLNVSDPDALQLPKAGLACVDTKDGRSGTLKFFITPKLVAQ